MLFALGLAMSLSVLAIIVGMVTLGVIIEAAWQQRREAIERRKFEETLTAAERERWRRFQMEGGVWPEFSDLIKAEREREVHLVGLPR